MSRVSICPKCVKELRAVAERQRKITGFGKVMYENDPSSYTGYWICDEYGPDDNKCMKCGSELKEISLEYRELMYIQRISKNPDYILAMDELKSKDIIEFESKMESIRQQLSDRDNQAKMQSEEQKMAEEQKTNTRHCPKCNGTNFTPVRKKFGLFMGFATNKVELVCNNCGYRMKAEN